MTIPESPVNDLLELLQARVRVIAVSLDELEERLAILSDITADHESRLEDIEDWIDDQDGGELK